MWCLIFRMPGDALSPRSLTPLMCLPPRPARSSCRGACAVVLSPDSTSGTHRSPSSQEWAEGAEMSLGISAGSGVPCPCP